MTDFPAEWRTVIPGYDPVATAAGAWFDGRAAEQAVKFFPACLKHVEGELAGHPFILETWQAAFVGCLFGWKKKDAKGRTVRRYREALLYVPRKNGKTPLCAGIGLQYLFVDKERGQQNYIAASTKEQAGLLFRHAKGMIEQEPVLSNACRVYGGNAPGGQSQSIVREREGSFLKIVAGDATVGQHGKNTNIAIIDELHEQPTRNLVDTFRTSMASANKPSPLLVYATTADFDRPSICNEVHDYACKVRDGVIEDTAFLPCIFEATHADDWTKPELWARVNPNYGISVSEDYLARECERAKEEPAYQNTFLRLHLNLKTEQAVRLIDMNLWDECGESFTAESLEGRSCFGGLDLATVNDLAAFSLCFPPEDEGAEYLFLLWHWCPAETAAKRERKGRIPYETWAKEGLIELTPRRDIDYRFIRSRINQLRDIYSIQTVAYDPWNATHIAKELTDEDGLEMVEYRQGYITMNEPTKGLLRLLLSRQIRHGGNKCLRWQASNLASKPDPAGNLKPDKEASADKIDGMVAMIMSLGLALRNPVVQSAYASHGVLYAGDLMEEDYAG